MTTTLLVDLNMADGNAIEVFLERDTYVHGSPAMPPRPGEWVAVVAEGGIRCDALVESVSDDDMLAVLKLDMSTWSELPAAVYTNRWTAPSTSVVYRESPTAAARF